MSAETLPVYVTNALTLEGSTLVRMSVEHGEGFAVHTIVDVVDDVSPEMRDSLIGLSWKLKETRITNV